MAVIGGRRNRRRPGVRPIRGSARFKPTVENRTWIDHVNDGAGADNGGAIIVDRYKAGEKRAIVGIGVQLILRLVRVSRAIAEISIP